MLHFAISQALHIHVKLPLHLLCLSVCQPVCFW